MNWYRQSKCVLAKDAPLNLRGWIQKWSKYFEWANSVLSSALKGEAHVAMNEFSNIVSRAYDEDKYYFDQTEYAYMWDDPNLFFRRLRVYSETLEGMNFWIEDQQAKKALSSMQYINDSLEKIEYYQIAFKQARQVGYKALRDYAGDPSSMLSQSDLRVFIQSARIIAKWFNDFSHIEKARKSMVEDIETLLEWGGSKGPEDRSTIDKLYHTTVAASNIEAEGFKADPDVKGLGGATDGMISTTLSKRIAISIADSLKRIMALANGSADLGTILKWAKRADVWGTMEEWGERGMSGLSMLMNLFEKEGEEKTIKMIEAGYVPFFPYGMDTPNLEDLPEEAIPIETQEIGGQQRVKSYWMKNKERKDELLLEIFRTYLGALQDSGKGYDPLFFGIDLENFRGLEEDDIGIFEIEADMDHPDIDYVQGMYEFRIPVEAIESAKRIA